jgi:hypothetical protein
MFVYRVHPADRQACRPCTLRQATGPDPAFALVRSEASPLLCRRHSRWLADKRQYDLSRTPEILTAHRRHIRLHLNHPDRGWTTTKIHAAWGMTRRWAELAPVRLPELSKRWHTRAEALGLQPRRGHEQALVSYPEAVALAEILTDLDWRRHVAMVRDHQLDKFYRRVGTRLGEPGIRPYSWGYDPMDAWIQRHRKKYASTRKEFWADPALGWTTKPFPEKGQFK